MVAALVLGLLASAMLFAHPKQPTDVVIVYETDRFISTYDVYNGVVVTRKKPTAPLGGAFECMLLAPDPVTAYWVASEYSDNH